jgi:hypothetical protein
MSNGSSFTDAVSRLTAQADAVGQLAQNAGGFAAVVAAFESKDPNAFRWVLGSLDLLPQCELICDWVRTKTCVLRCMEVCGPPREKIQTPNLQEFARAVVQLASNEKVLRRVVDAISCGNAEDYRAALDQLDLSAFCYPLCRWVCSIIYNRVCEVVCNPEPVSLPDAVNEIRAAGMMLAGVVANEKALAAIANAAATLDCETLQSTIEQAGFAPGCEIICHLVCSWRCTWECLELCEIPSPVATPGVYGVEEARNFALASRQLANQPRALGDLVIAVQNRDAEAYRAIIARFGLGPYCQQVCAWVCSTVCHEFCICVCPPVGLFPEFFAIGGYEYQTQIDSALPATGLTVGDTRAFYSTLRLNGILTQTLGGKPLEYRFEYQPITMASTTLAAPITTISQTSITVASSAGFPSTPFNVVIGSANGGYEIMTVNSVFATTWTVARHQQGTTAALAVVGATIVTGATAPASWTPVLPAQIARTVIAYLERPFPLPPLPYAVNGLATDLPVAISSTGWISVPQGSNISLTNDMIELVSTSLAPFPAADETGVSASNPANHPLPTDLYFGIRMRVRQAGSSTDSDGGTCSVVAIDNTLYNNVNRHPDWDGGVVNNQYAVAMVDIKELQAAGCADVTNSLTVLFTASHPNLGPVGITMTGPGGPYNFTLPTPVPETGDWYGTAANDFTIADLTPCAYIVTLSVYPLLTDGDSPFPTDIYDQIAFCLTASQAGDHDLRRELPESQPYAGGHGHK